MLHWQTNVKLYVQNVWNIGGTRLQFITNAFIIARSYCVELACLLIGFLSFSRPNLSKKTAHTVKGTLPGELTRRVHQELQRTLVIAQKISAHMRRKLVIYISALYVLRYCLVCSVVPRKNFAALTAAPKFQCNGSAETSSATDAFFSSRAAWQLVHILNSSVRGGLVNCHHF